MRRAKRTMKKMKKKTPGNRIVVRTKKKRPSYHHCSRCKAKLNRSRMLPGEIKKVPKTKRRPERLLPHLCSRCMRAELKARVRK